MPDVIGGQFSRARGKRKTAVKVKMLDAAVLDSLRHRQFIEYLYAGIGPIMREAGVRPDEMLEKTKITFVLGCVVRALSCMEEAIDGPQEPV